MSQNTNINNLIINQLTQEQYKALTYGHQIKNNELYLTTNWDEKEEKVNKTTVVNEESSANQYPSAKAFYNSQVEQDNKINQLKESIYALKSNMITNTKTGTSLELEHCADMKFCYNTTKWFEFYGNTVQDNFKMIYICNGEETGDYYFVYNNINYQFTMPTIESGNLLIFDTTTLKLFLNGNEITTTTDNTGTLIVLSLTPNPDCPQDIKTVTGNVNFKIISKNLLNFNEDKYSWGGDAIIKGSTIRLTGVPAIDTSLRTKTTFDCFISSGTTLTASARIIEGKENFTTGWIQPDIRLIFSDGTYQDFGDLSFHTEDYKDRILSNTITLQKNVVQIANRIGASSPKTADSGDIVLGLQLEIGTEATEYEEHQEETFLLSLGSLELCSSRNGEYRDYFYKENGQWYKYCAIDKVILNGSEDWVIAESAVVNDPGFISFKNYYPFYPLIRTNYGFYCDKFNYKPYDGGFRWIPDFVGISDGGGYTATYVRIEENRLNTSDVAGFKEWLANNNLTVYFCYKNGKSPSVQITNKKLISQLENLFNNIRPYKGDTFITTTTETNPYLSAEYFYDNKLIIDELKFAVITLGGVI